MRPRALIVTACLAGLAIAVWRAELFTVQRPGERPRALASLPSAERRPAALDVVLPAVPVGMEHLSATGGTLLIHYWAPWEHHARDQALTLDSLRREPGFERLRIVVVCFDPFPSVARYVARNRLGLSVLLDGEHRLRTVLPCPSIPYTYVIDAEGCVAVSQPGEVDWRSPSTRTTLRSLLVEPFSAQPGTTL